MKKQLAKKKMVDQQKALFLKNRGVLIAKTSPSMNLQTMNLKAMNLKTMSSLSSNCQSARFTKKESWHSKKTAHKHLHAHRTTIYPKSLPKWWTRARIHFCLCFRQQWTRIFSKHKTFRGTYSNSLLEWTQKVYSTRSKENCWIY